MKAAVMSEHGVEVIEVDRPLPAEGNVLIKVMAAGICGTDLAIRSGKLKVPLPLILGHEFAGDIVELGKGALGAKIGSRVTSEINLTCGRCHFCKAGIQTHCMSRKAIGIDVHGAFAEFVVVPTANVHVLPKPISYEEGVFVEPLAAAIQTIKMSPVKSDDTVVVLGDGRLGQLIAQAVKAVVPSARIFVLGKHESKLRLAKRLCSADLTINVARENPLSSVLKETNGLGANVVVEATGNPDALNLALSLVRHRGIVALKSTHGDPTSVDATQIAVREIMLQGSRCGPFDEAIKMLREERVSVKPLISARYPLSKTAEALEYAKDPETLKVLLLP